MKPKYINVWPFLRERLVSGPVRAQALVAALMSEYDVSPTEALLCLWDNVDAGLLVERDECRKIALGR